MANNIYQAENIARLCTSRYPFTVNGQEFIGIASARSAADTAASTFGVDVAIMEYGRTKYPVRADGSVY